MRFLKKLRYKISKILSFQQEGFKRIEKIARKIEIKKYESEKKNAFAY